MAERLDFTVRGIVAISPPDNGRLEFKDTKEAGLYLRVTHNGVKTFSYVGRAKGSSRVERLTIGKFPTVKPEEARRRARELAGRLASGKSVAEAARALRGEMTVGELQCEYLAHLKAHTRRPEKFELAYRLYIEPYFHRRRLSEVTSADVTRWLRDLPTEILKRRAQAEAEREAKREAGGGSAELALDASGGGGGTACRTASNSGMSPTRRHSAMPSAHAQVFASILPLTARPWSASALTGPFRSPPNEYHHCCAISFPRPGLVVIGQAGLPTAKRPSLLRPISFGPSQADVTRVNSRRKCSAST